MGGTKDFKEKGIFEYETIGTVDGIKVIRSVTGLHNAPMYAGDSNAYIRADRRDVKREIIIYDPVKKARSIEINWGHSHDGSDPNGFHVHVNAPGATGIHKGDWRPPTPEELELGMKARYGKIEKKN